jgi:MFS family permease
VLRFIAGFGLAGELGAGLTLVSEQLPKEKRSMAVALVAGFGILGAVSAFFINNIFAWRTSYYIGGILGLLLLIMRIRVHESGLYKNVKQATIERGNFLMFFTDRKRFSRYIKCILIGVPVWYIIGILITFADQFGKEFGIAGVDPGKAIMFLYLGIAFGNLSVGWLSQQLKSRKKTLFIFYGITILFCTLFFLQSNSGTTIFYVLSFCLGFGAGFNVIYLTFGVEQFGTNLRATAAISIPNMVRGALPLMIILFKFMRSIFNDYVTGAWVTGIVLFVVAIVSALSIKESFGKELDFLEV